MAPNEHSRILGILFLIVGGLISLLGLFLGIVYGLMGLMFAATAKKEGALVGGVFVILAVVMGLLFLAVGALHLLSGWKLYKGKQSAKVWAIISSILVLPVFIPFGTALGIYGLWFIFGDQGKAFFSGRRDMSYTPQQQPPPPQSWQ
jgi:glucan phosphoethanolaminetransferase (alkaline phosphatase superfamily)